MKIEDLVLTINRNSSIGSVRVFDMSGKLISENYNHDQIYIDFVSAFIPKTPV